VLDPGDPFVVMLWCRFSTEEITAVMKFEFAAWQGTSTRRDDASEAFQMSKHEAAQISNLYLYLA